MDRERPKRNIFALFFEFIQTMMVNFSIMYYWLGYKASSPGPLSLVNTTLEGLLGADLTSKVILYLNYGIMALFLLSGLVGIFFDPKPFRRFVLFPLFLLWSEDILLGLVRGVQDGSLLKTDLGQVWPLYGKFLVMAGNLLL